MTDSNSLYKDSSSGSVASSPHAFCMEREKDSLEGALKREIFGICILRERDSIDPF